MGRDNRSSSERPLWADQSPRQQALPIPIPVQSLVRPRSPPPSPAAAGNTWTTGLIEGRHPFKLTHHGGYSGDYRPLDAARHELQIVFATSGRIPPCTVSVISAKDVALRVAEHSCLEAKLYAAAVAEEALHSRAVTLAKAQAATAMAEKASVAASVDCTAARLRELDTIAQQRQAEASEAESLAEVSRQMVRDREQPALKELGEIYKHELYSATQSLENYKAEALAELTRAAEQFLQKLLVAQTSHDDLFAHQMHETTRTRVVRELLGRMVKAKTAPSAFPGADAPPAVGGTSTPPPPKPLTVSVAAKQFLQDCAAALVPQVSMGHMQTHLAQNPSADAQDLVRHLEAKRADTTVSSLGLSTV